MKLADADPGDIIVDRSDGDRFRVIAHKVQLEDGRLLPLATLEALDVRAGLGKGGTAPTVSRLGRRSGGLKGTLVVNVPWRNDDDLGGSRYLSLATNGSGLDPEADFLRRWDRWSWAVTARPANGPFVAIANPRPYVTDDGRGVESQEPFGSTPLLHDGLVTLISAEGGANWTLSDDGQTIIDTPTGDPVPWLGESRTRPSSSTLEAPLRHRRPTPCPGPSRLQAQDDPR